MAERFSQKKLRVRPSSDEEKIVTNAKKHFEKTLDRIEVMQKFLFFCPEENTKPFDRDYATINT